jgi:hypothetical protein
LIRVTILDTDQTISFLAEMPTVLRLVAGCSINPANLDELLIATDIYQRGLAAMLMSDLMEFDKTLRRKGADFIHQAITEAEQGGEALDLTFQVIDEITRMEAMRCRGCPLVIIDLKARQIHLSADVAIPPAGEVRIRVADTDTDRLVSYILPQDWKIEQVT